MARIGSLSVKGARSVTAFGWRVDGFLRSALNIFEFVTWLPVLLTNAHPLNNIVYIDIVRERLQPFCAFIPSFLGFRRGKRKN